MPKERLDWQLDQWMEAMRWFLRWLTICSESGVEALSVAERVKVAVERAGMRRGLALRTRECYGSWAVGRDG